MRYCSSRDTVHTLLFTDITVHARTVHRHYCSLELLFACTVHHL
ncbi:hypothetical protein A2U01_0084192, partial [Trifolium medium]|nr:hypothetical protein [Trifolium medium]